MYVKAHGGHAKRVAYVGRSFDCARKLAALKMTENEKQKKENDRKRKTNKGRASPVPTRRELKTGFSIDIVV
jgi:hypothetical protein